MFSFAWSVVFDMFARVFVVRLFVSVFVCYACCLLPFVVVSGVCIVLLCVCGCPGVVVVSFWLLFFV